MFCVRITSYLHVDFRVAFHIIFCTKSMLCFLLGPFHCLFASDFFEIRDEFWLNFYEVGEVQRNIYLIDVGKRFPTTNHGERNSAPFLPFERVPERFAKS